MPTESDHLSRPVRVPKSLPKDWRFQRLLECCLPQQWPTLAKSEMTPDGYVVFGANGPLGRYPKYNHEHETIAIGCRGTCGTIQIIPPKSYVSGNAMCLDGVKEEIVLPSFLYHALTYRNVSDAVTGSAQPQITRNSLKRVTFPLPLPDEQAAIARVLDAVDTALERTRSAIARARELRRGLLQTCFEFRSSCEQTKDTDAGRIPQSWDAIKGKQAFVILTGGCSSVDAIRLPREGEIPDAWFMKVDDFNAPVNRRCITRTKIGFRTIDNPDFKVLPLETIVIAKRGAAILKNRVRTTAAPVAIDPNLMALQALPGMCPRFLKYQLEWRKLSRYCESSGIPQLNNKDLYPRYFLRAPTDKQQQIVETIAAADAYEDALIGKRDAFEVLKKSLMHDLLTGRVRVAPASAPKAQPHISPGQRPGNSPQKPTQP